MREFQTFHPVVNFVYFVLVIGFACLILHPVALGISAVCGFVYSAILKGRKAVRTNLLIAVPTAVCTALLNPMFNHAGVTVLTYLPSGNPLTAESVLYGVCAAAMLLAVIFWFSCYHEVMTSDKFIYLFGRILPALSLVFSMTLRFVPRFAAQLRTVRNARRCLGQDMTSGSIPHRIRSGLSVFSAMMTWALENSVETADSMKARGYGLKGRTAFSLYTMQKRDGAALAALAVLGIAVAVGYFGGVMSFRFFPSVRSADLTLCGIAVFAAYIILCFFPVMIELWEVKKWKHLPSNR